MKKFYKIRINTPDNKEYWLHDYGMSAYRSTGRIYRTHSEAVLAAASHPDRFTNQFFIVPYTEEL
ncbi:MAG TPA: hypothetical protein VJJ83_05190 [Candidatus Babeliales bacterium]|nr:hypothetical protein [Candidatus Babeliales bacterium]